MGPLKRTVAGLVLAAGASRRMGEPKQLLRMGNKTLLERVLGEVLKSELDQVILVLGHRAVEIEETIGPLPVPGKLRIIKNEHYQDGMSTSIIAGLAEVEKEYDHVMIILADMPNITAPLINHLLRYYLASGKTLGAIRITGRRSHPVILGKAWYGALGALKGDRGARGIFEDFRQDVCLVDAPGSYEDLDIDTPEEYRTALRDIVP